MSKKPKLVIIRGLPGTGKSTKAQTYEGFEHHEADHYWEENGQPYHPGQVAKAHQQCRSRVWEDLEEGKDVVVSNTFVTKNSLQEYLDMAAYHRVDLEIVDLTEQYGSVHNVPEEAMRRMADSWEPWE